MDKPFSPWFKAIPPKKNEHAAGRKQTSDSRSSSTARGEENVRNQSEG